MKYFDKNKHKMFPGMNFKSNQDKYKKIPVNKLSYTEWFWFHPSAYKLIHYGFNSIVMVVFSIVYYIAFINDISVMKAVSLIVVGFMGYKIITKINKRKEIKNMTFYHIWLKEE